MGIALLIDLCLYRFETYGVQTHRLLSLDALAAFGSSGFSFVLGLGLAYPLSFFIKPSGFLIVWFSEPVRWMATLFSVAIFIRSYRSNLISKLFLMFFSSASVLLAPYIIRLFLMPESVQYDIPYILSGRVFYPAFAMIAITWGHVAGRRPDCPRLDRVLNWALGALAVVGWAHALLILYDPGDFGGLQVAQTVPVHAPPSWNPLAESQPLWLVALGMLIVGSIAARRRFAARLACPTIDSPRESLP